MSARSGYECQGCGWSGQALEKAERWDGLLDLHGNCLSTGWETGDIHRDTHMPLPPPTDSLGTDGHPRGKIECASVKIPCHENNQGSLLDNQDSLLDNK